MLKVNLQNGSHTGERAIQLLLKSKQKSKLKLMHKEKASWCKWQWWLLVWQREIEDDCAGPENIRRRRRRRRGWRSWSGAQREKNKENFLKFVPVWFWFTGRNAHFPDTSGIRSSYGFFFFFTSALTGTTNTGWYGKVCQSRDVCNLVGVVFS